jgi:hypothetical protein
MEQFDHLEVAQEVAAILKSGGTIANTQKAAALLRKIASDFSGAPAFAADLRKEKDFYALELDLPMGDIEWMACILEGNAMKGKAMALTRYEHENIKSKIDGYMIPSRERPLETREQQFERAKAELLGHLKRQIEQVEAFTFADLSKKVS